MSDQLSDFQNTLFVGDEIMPTLMRAVDWSQTPIGPVDQWPQSLRTTVSIVLASGFSMMVFWGPEAIQIYNDAFISILAAKHPAALGQPAFFTWSEIWAQISPMLDSVRTTGKAVYAEDLLVLLIRRGFVEEAYFTFSYSPVRDESAAVMGILVTVAETTGRLIAERKLNTLRELGAESSKGKTADEACRIAAAVIEKNASDIPFALLYLLDDNQRRARLADCVGVDPGTSTSPLFIDLMDETAVWPLDEALKIGLIVRVEDLQTRLESVPQGPWPEAPHTALILPLTSSGSNHVIGFLVAGASSRQMLDDTYHGFFNMVAGQISTAITNARTYEGERQRIEALAELDRAKTEFFSNISHEFRTPLTLMLNPLRELENELSPVLTPQQSETLDAVRRNSQQLLKLVNTLLDFSRIESNRIHASYEPTDLSTLTEDLVSNFRSAVERAGLRLIVDCPPLMEPVYVDPEMWEKIVLNLLSNAFKFTFEGEIAVSLRLDADQVVFTIRDTGIGIAAHDLPQIFDRFQRVRGARSRTHEGSGIGLSLVQDLVRFQGGDIYVESVVGSGTVFTITLPRGSAHLSQTQIDSPRHLSSTAVGALPYVDEALHWVSDVKPTTEMSRVASLPTGIDEGPVTQPDTRDLVLIVDDNADMRDYLKRVLERQYQVEMASDGQMALNMIAHRRPELVLTDAMMPQVDGFELLAQIRANPQTRLLPVILLSARAGEEARIEGLQAGADDYLVKPFVMRELLASVQAHLKIAQLRQNLVIQEQSSRISNERLIESIADPFYVLDENWNFVYINRASEALWRKPREEMLNRNVWELFPQTIGSHSHNEMYHAVETRQNRSFEAFSTIFQIWFEVSLYPNENGLSVYYRDINARKDVVELRARLQVMFDQSVVGIVFGHTDGRLIQANPGFCDMLGYTADEIPHLTVKDITHPDDYDTDMTLAAQLTNGVLPSYSIEKRYIRKDQTIVWGNMTSSLVRTSDGRTDYAVAIVQDIDEKKQAQDAVQSAQFELDVERKRIIDIFDSISDAFVALDRDYRFTYLNAQAINLYRRLTLRPDALFVGEVMWDSFSGSYSSPFGVAFRQAIEDNAFEQLRAYFPPLDAWFDVRIYPSREGLSIYFADITQEHNARQALREAQDRLRLMIDSAKDYAIFALDQQGHITNWNAGAERVFGYDEDNILGQDESVLYTTEDIEAGVPELERRQATEVGYAEHERWHQRRDGTRFYASGMMRPIRSETGELQGFTKVTRDTTQHRLAVQRTQVLQQLAADLSAHVLIHDMADIIIEYSLAAVNGSIGNIFLHNSKEQVLHRLATEGVSPAIYTPYDRVPLDMAAPLTDAVRDARIIWVATQVEYEECYPHIRDAVIQLNLHSVLAIPLMVEGRIIGVLGISFDYEKIITPDEHDLLIAVSHLCAQALERGRLYEQAAVAATLRERQRLARDLHDAVNQTLFSAMMITESLPRLWQRNPDRVFPLLEQVLTLNKAAAAEMRVLLWELRPEALEKTPLEDLYTQLVNAIQGRKQMQVLLDVDLEVPLEMPLPVHVAFYRIAQEAINNVIKHAQAQHLTLRLISSDNEVELSIIDDGLGFEKTNGSGIGMGSMRERAEEIHAALSVTSVLNQGTRVILTWQRG